MPQAEQAEAQAHIEGQPGRGPPVVLKIRFGDDIAIEVLVLGAVLLKVLDASGCIRPKAAGADQKIGECVSKAQRTTDVAETQNALNITSICAHRLVQFVALGD